ncbi:MAG: hypothetical protein EPO07_13320 [Verrucomicrobia bacterium]|nr:MAG: hypothetical protein EPO07_13320 [Verrucomicrobiota bacterium]
MNIPPQTIYQHLRQFFPTLVRSDRVVHQDSGSLSIWLRESPDRQSVEAFCIEFEKPPTQQPLALFQTFRAWLPQEMPALESLIDELTDHGRAAALTHKSKQIADWSITVSVFHTSVVIRFDHVF